MTERMTHFDSVATKLRGKLIEPAGDGARPLVVMVHGSESASAVAGSPYAYVLAALGLDVFVYDKRGTGGSEGIYTQNFELLADDAAAALGEAQKLAAGHVSRSGYYGGSQGGWVAPLAATRSHADFVAVGFGLVVSPIEEDREQMMLEARSAKLGPKELAQIDRLSKATGKLAGSHFITGYDDLARVRQDIGGAPWASDIHGEYSGDMLRMSDADLHRIGQARFDNVGLIWDYDAVAALKKLKVPLLWVLAGEDREAPIEGTKPALSALAAAGKDVTVYLFPDTDHGIFEYRTLPDGSRQMTRVAEGYFRLLGDWIKGRADGTYGRAERLR
jgi:pimeloyl-ACP methyl ester carboxylesterase